MNCRSSTLGQALIASLLLGWACGGGEGAVDVDTDFVRSPLLARAEIACGLEASREPTVSYVPEVPCRDPGYTCCIDRSDFGDMASSEYDVNNFHINYVGSERCRKWIEAHKYCEYENAVTWQNGIFVDRCITPC